MEFDGADLEALTVMSGVSGAAEEKARGWKEAGG